MQLQPEVRRLSTALMKVKSVIYAMFSPINVYTTIVVHRETRDNNRQGGAANKTKAAAKKIL